MTRTKRAGLLLAVTLALQPIAAQAWWAWNRHEVLPVQEGVWEVVSRVGSSPQDYWCGIGDFAIRELRTGAAQRIYIWEGVGPSVNRPQKRSVKFALTPPPGADTSSSYSLSIKRPGENISANLARSYCYNHFADPFYLRP